MGDCRASFAMTETSLFQQPAGFQNAGFSIAGAIEIDE